jgi:hypothetical protein
MKRDVPEIMASLSVHVSNSKEDELLPVRLAQAADAQPQQAQRAQNQFVPAGSRVYSGHLLGRDRQPRKQTREGHENKEDVDTKTKLK